MLPPPSPRLSGCDDGRQTLRLERPYYEQEELNAELKYSKPEHNFERPTLCRSGFGQCLLSVFPVFRWLAQYDLRRDIVGDLVSGGTVAVMHIPQGMGYALLANVPPILGIYTAFFPVLVYFIFGTSRHNSMGTFAVVAIMVGKAVTQLSHPAAGSLPDGAHNISAGAANSTSGTVIHDLGASYTPTEVAATLCFLVGAMQLVMWMLRLGIISTLLSETLVSGFTTGAAIHVLSSQVKDLLGLTLPPMPTNFKLIYTYIEVFHQLAELRVNWIAITVSSITILILVLNNDYLKPHLAKRCTIPVPIELIAVVGGTVVARLLDLTLSYSVRPIGHIPTGFPALQAPRFELLGSLLVDGFMITMVSYTVSVSMALIFAQRLNYEIDFNQELLAMGSANMCGSFFTCLPVAASLSRSLIQQSVGGRTQLASLVSCSILAVVLLWIGPFFEQLPRCVLASVIVVSLKGMLLQVRQVCQFWRLSRLDAGVWLATFLTVVVVAIDIGLAVGIALSVACIFIRGLKPYTCLLGNVPRTDFYLDISRYKAAEELPFVKIFHYCGSLNFAVRNAFKAELCRLIGLDLAKETRRMAAKADGDGAERYDQLYVRVLIVDFSALSYIDPSGCTALKHLVGELNKIGIAVYIAASSCPSYELMKKCDLRETADGAFKFYPTVHDAVHHALEVVSPISVISETS